MREGEPGWFYIGNGLLQYKDSNGWTDQYQDLNNPAKAPNLRSAASSDVGPVLDVVGKGARAPWPFPRLCASAARHLIKGFGWLLVILGRLLVILGRLLADISLRSIVGLARLTAFLRPRLMIGLGRLRVGLGRLSGRFWRWLGGLVRSMNVIWPRVMVGLGRLMVGFRRLMGGLGSSLGGLGRSLGGGLGSSLVGVGRSLGRLGSSLGGVGRSLSRVGRTIATRRSRIATQYRQASASMSIRSVARGRPGPSNSEVLVDRPPARTRRTMRARHGHPHGDILGMGTWNHAIRLGPGRGEEWDETKAPELFLDPGRLEDLNVGVAHPGKGNMAKPLVDG